MSSADVWKCWDSALGHEGCQAASSKSTGPQQQNVHYWNRSVSSAVRSTFHTADVDDQWCQLLAYNCPSSTAEQFHGGIDTWALRAWIVLDRWHRASGAHHAVVTTNCYWTVPRECNRNHKKQPTGPDSCEKWPLKQCMCVHLVLY